MLKLVPPLLALLFGASQVMAQPAPTLEGKTVTMLIGHGAGGGTDLAGRMIAGFLAKYLPGQPAIVVQNMIGADGIVAQNHFANRMPKDGTAITMASSNSADPMQYRNPQAKYDPASYKVIGGVGRGGTTLIISKAAIARLSDKSATPVVMGSPSGIPRSGMQMTAWGIAFLGWNAKWVSGYRGTKDLFIALERGEIDMTASSNIKEAQRLIETGKFQIFAQSGSIEAGRYVSRSDLSGVPVFPALMEGKIKNPTEQKAFDYWVSLVAADKWLALPPGSPDPIVAMYRTAYQAALKDPDFMAKGRALSDEFTPQAVEDVEKLITTLGSTPPEATGFITKMLATQGLTAK